MNTVRPLIRLIQHFSCTGGSLLSSCIASMPKIRMLSELNPLSKLHLEYPRFSPTDISYLAMIGNFPDVDDLNRKIFRVNMRLAVEHLHNHGMVLLVRDHSHTDYLVDTCKPEPGTVRQLLEGEYSIKTTLTVRHPVDSYLSMQKKGWVRFEPANFEEYCRRYLVFIQQNKPAHFVRYEDFVMNPAATMQDICVALKIDYRSDFVEKMNQIEVTGSSGRSSAITIEPRPRHKFGNKFANEAAQSRSYREFCQLFNYEPDPYKAALRGK